MIKEYLVQEETLIDASKVPDDQEWALCGWNYRSDEQKYSSAPGDKSFFDLSPGAEAKNVSRMVVNSDYHTYFFSTFSMLMICALWSSIVGSKTSTSCL